MWETFCWEGMEKEFLIQAERETTGQIPRPQPGERCSPNVLAYPPPHVLSTPNLDIEFYFCVGGKGRGAGIALPRHCSLFQKLRHRLFPSHAFNCAEQLLSSSLLSPLCHGVCVATGSQKRHVKGLHFPRPIKNSFSVREGPLCV